VAPPCQAVVASGSTDGPRHSRVESRHPSEQEFARFLEYYRIRWRIRAGLLPVAWEGERVAEIVTPDLYLPEHDLTSS